MNRYQVTFTFAKTPGFKTETLTAAKRKVVEMFGEENPVTFEINENGNVNVLQGADLELVPAGTIVAVISQIV